MSMCKSPPGAAPHCRHFESCWTSIGVLMHIAAGKVPPSALYRVSKSHNSI